MNFQLRFSRIHLALLVTLLLVACAPATGGPASEQPPGVTPSVAETVRPTAEQTSGSTPVAATPPATETITPVATAGVQESPISDVQPAPAGLVYRDEVGLWQIESGGQSRLLASKAAAVPSPDLSRAYHWDQARNTLTLITLATGEETEFTPEAQLNEPLNWADNQTILLGVYLLPGEADWPNYGHLASLDIFTGQLNILDAEHLMFSVPAQSPYSQTIAYSSDGPLLYSAEGGVRPFLVEAYSGLANVQGHLSPAWSPDGRHLAWIVTGGPFGEDPNLTTGLAIYNLEEGTAELALAFDPARWGATPPAAVWSPDGLWLALRVFANGPDGSGIWLLSADGAERHYLLGVSGNANYPVWSPDGRQLIYLDFADEDEAPYSQLLNFDMETAMSTPIALEHGLPLSWSAETAAPAIPVNDPLCGQIERPALLLIDRGDYYITNFKDRDACEFAFPGELPGLIQSGGDVLFYHELDFTTQTAVVERMAPDGASTALTFTETGPEAQFLHYIVSQDGRQIAWSAGRANETGAPVSDLWLAGTDGEGQMQLISGWPATENRFVIPIRFSADGQTLYFALQPIGVGGSWVSFSGRYDSLFAIPTSGGQPEELFQCPAGNLLCLGDFSGEGDALIVAYTDSAAKTIYVLAADGRLVRQFSFSQADFLGYPSFGPGGEMAFYVATIGQHLDGYPVPQPGTIYLVQPPYDSEPDPVKSSDSVATLIGWLDGGRLVYNSIDPGGNWGTVVTNLVGEASIWGPGPTQFIAILR